ncbi:MAG: hypothetical protein EBR82_18810 [Caulobacteraceae bacterium]|nr:hypothetical protein [Caulobacteraceae bacterium]
MEPKKRQFFFDKNSSDPNQVENDESKKADYDKAMSGKKLPNCDTCGGVLHNGFYGSHTTCDDCVSEAGPEHR